MSFYGIKTGIIRTVTSYSNRKGKAFWGNTNLLGSTRETAQRSFESALCCIAAGKSLDEVAENVLTTYKAVLDCVAFIKSSQFSEDTEVRANKRFVYDMSDHNAILIWAIEAWIRGLDLNYFMAPKSPPMKYSPVRWISDNKMYQPGINTSRKPNNHYAKLEGIEYTPTEHRGALKRLISEVLHPEATPKQVTEMVKAARKGYAKASKAYLKALAAREERLNKA